MIILKKEKSKIHKYGIFAKTPIPKGLKFYIIPLGNILDAPKRGCAYIGNNRYVCDKNVLNLVNHSCNPNSLLDISSKQPSLISLRNIEAGEEITCDYNKTEIGGVKVKCTCGSKNCKGYFLIIK